MKSVLTGPSLRFLLTAIAIVHFAGRGDGEESERLQIATFSADITIPIGHHCMGVLPTKSTQIDDALEAHGFVLLGSGPAVVLVALDWCEVRNGAYDQWRDALAKAAGTSRNHVLVCSLHQHDAPITDSGAQQYLDSVGLENELYDPDFHAHCIRVTAAKLKAAIVEAQPLTHIGVGQAKVEKIASNRRVVHADGSIKFDRYSRMNTDSYQAKFDEGEIDPMVKSLAFYNGDKALVVLSCYATHPMSRYGSGAVSADFVGMARRCRQLDTPGTKQIYVSGCSGDVTAGKYNNGTPVMRGILADRLYLGMKNAWQNTEKHEIRSSTFRCTTFQLPFHPGDALTRKSMQNVLENREAVTEDRITAAMGLSSLDRVERGQPIDLPCIELASARIVLLPGEAFVGYQLMAQALRPNSFVMAIGYGECWPGYIPTEQAFDEGFGHGWRWVGRGCEAIIREKLDQVL
ncbi:MAG: hypothetical protein MI861_19795 [Pirellulales bacterium]|nr:hypothetical protein [Pirellulales bacterium]